MKKENGQISDEEERITTNGDAAESIAANGGAGVPGVAEEEGGEGKESAEDEEDNIEELYDMDHYDSEDEGAGRVETSL